MRKIVFFLPLVVLIAVLVCLPVPGFAQEATTVPEPHQVTLGNVSGTVVTLYYYDAATGQKGDLVQMPDNPQYVQWDEQAAAPGTYTFTRVPEGTYYIEAVHDNNSWFAIAAVYRGTTTANVAIPPAHWTAVESTVTPTATPAATATSVGTPLPATPIPAPAQSPSPTQTPGSGAAAALLAFALGASVLLRKK